MSGQTEVLLIDAGNSFLKWALVANGELYGHGSRAYERDDADSGITRVLGTVDAAVSRVCVSNVAGDTVGAALIRASGECFAVEPEFASVCRKMPVLEVAYSEPHRLGVDRWLAMLGACMLHDSAVCVADCGTALTLDAVSADGRHLGGAIVPGSGLMMKSLNSDTAQIGRGTEQSPGQAAGQAQGQAPGGQTPGQMPGHIPDTFFGDSTPAAVAAGCTLALCGAVDRFMAEAAGQLPSPPLLFVTGGDRERLLKFVHSDAVEVPDLVLLGLKYLFCDAP